MWSAPASTRKRFSLATPAAFGSRYWISGPIAAFVAPLHVDKGLFQVIDAVERCWWMGRPVTLVTVGSAFGSGRQRLSVLSAKVTRIRLLRQRHQRSRQARSAGGCRCSRCYRRGRLVRYRVPGGLGSGQARHRLDGLGMRDVITPDENGLLVRFNDLGATERALIRLLDEPDPACPGRVRMAGGRSSSATPGITCTPGCRRLWRRIWDDRSTVDLDHRRQLQRPGLP